MDWTVMKKAATSLLSALSKAAAVFFITLTIADAGEILLQQPTPVFEKANVFSKVLRVLPPGTYQTAGACGRVFSVRHPIAYYHDFYKLPDGSFLTPQMGVSSSGEPFSLAAAPLWQTYLTVFPAALLIVLLYLLVKGKIQKTLPENSWKTLLLLAAVPVLVRQILVLCELSFWGNALPSAADEPGYFKSIYDMLHGSFSGPWHFTVGLGILYLPFILLSGAKEYYDIAVFFSYFDALVLAPLALGTGFFVLKNFKLPYKWALGAVLIWAVYPFFVYHRELWGTLSFSPILALPNFAEGVFDWWRFYSVCIHTGFNAMSDTPGLLAVLGTILLAQKLSFSRRNLFLVGMAYGFCCLIRINYIFFAPLIAFICLEKMPQKSLRELCFAFCAASGGFFLVFIWQLLINCYQFGNPLTFGYALHYLDFPPEKRPDTGFNWSTLAELRNIKFLMGANKFLMAGGIAGLFFVRDRYSRIALSLAVLPLILFFFGYTHTYCDARRFILMAFLIFPAAFCAACSNLFALQGTGVQKFLPFLMLPVMVILFFVPEEILAICLCLLLLRTLFDLQQKLFRGIL